MKELFLFQTGSSFVLYLLFFIAPWFKAWRSKEVNKSYFTGLLFATLFYYGIPIWLWLYGLKTTSMLIISCIGIAIILAFIFRLVFSAEQTFTIGVLTQIPVRVIAGGWLAKNHARLRNTAIA